MGHDFGGDAGAVKAQRVQRAGPQEKRLPHSSNPAFYLMYHPLRWQFVSDDDHPSGEWLPLLGSMSLDVGVGGVDKGGDDSFARVDAARRGWTVLDWTLVPESGPGSTSDGQYISAWPASGPAGADLLHVTAWEQPRHMAGRILPTRIDTAGYRAWLRWLVSAGHVAPPGDEAVAIQVALQQAEIELLRGKADRHPHLASRVEAAEARATAMGAATVEDPAPVKPRKAKPTGAE